MRKLAVILIALTLAATAVAGGEKPTATPEEYEAKIRAKLQQVGWLGVEMDRDAQDRTVITAVVPSSPAAAAGFQPGDVLLVMNGVPLTGADKEAMKKAKASMKPGAKSEYTVLRNGSELALTAVLSAMPEKMVEEHVKKHMQKYHSSPEAAKK